MTTIDGSRATSGQPCRETLMGENQTIAIEVIAPDGATATVYRLVVEGDRP